VNGTDHPPVELLADRHEGLLPGDLAAAVDRHVQGCASCAGLMSGLDRVRADLGAEGRTPITMPQDVAGRLEAAIGRVAAERSAGVPSLEDHRSQGQARRRHGFATGLVAAATVVVATVVGVAVITGNDGASDSSAGGGSDALSGDPEGAGQGGSMEEQPQAAPSDSPSKSLDTEPPASPDQRPRATAQDLVDGTLEPVALGPCAVPPRATDALVSQITVNGEPQVLVVYPDDERYVVFDCAATNRLDRGPL